MTSLKKILLSLLVIIVVLIVPHSGIIPFPFGYCIPILIFIWLFLKSRKENFESIGFSFSRFSAKAILIGTLAGTLIFAFMNWILFPLLEKVIQLPAADLGDFAKLEGNSGFYIFILIMGWLVGGFYEEIVFHGFIFTRFEKMIPGKYVTLLSFLLTNTIFALYHLQLGAKGVINAFIAGSLYHLVMLNYKRNIWYAIFTHAVFDTIALTFLYVGYK